MRTLQLHACFAPGCSLGDLQDDDWEDVGCLTVQPGQTEVKVSFAAPIVATCIKVRSIGVVVVCVCVMYECVVVCVCACEKERV